MIKRFTSHKLKILFENFKVVYVAGARQVGKTTLIANFANLSGLRAFSKQFENVKNLFVFYGGNSISAQKVNDKIAYLIPYKLLF